MKAIMGRCRPGAMRFKGEHIDGLQPHEIAQRGLGYVPENRDIFPELTVRENLLLGMKSSQHGGAGRSTTCSSSFPGCASAPDAPGGVLSGGEQQMLTICRTLMGDPDLIMIDEPTEGLAPKMVELVRDSCSRRSPRVASRSC